MPSISRIRITNLVYENGAKRYGDEIFQFDGCNGVILLENGGGKTVFVQAVLQTILPHTPLAERKAKDTFSLENSSAHLAVEWLINEKPRRYALTAVTLFSSKTGLDSYKYVYEYEPGDEHSLERLPFVRKGTDGRLRPSSKEEMADYYQLMNRGHMSAAYFNSNREYQSYIEENLKIISSEWKSVARINSAEGEIEGFFEGCRTTTQLVDQLLIPTVQEALAGNGVQDFAEAFEKQREHFKKHRQLREKIEESQQVDEQISSYVDRYRVYEESRQILLKTKGEIRSLYQLAAERQEQIGLKLEEQRQAGKQLQEQREEAQRRQASFQLASREQEWENARQTYAQRRDEYDSQQQEYDIKNARLQNLEIARLKAQIRSSEEAMQYYTEQIEMLATDSDVQDLEMKIKLNAGALRYCYLQEEAILAGRGQDMQNDLEKLAKDLQAIEIHYQKEYRTYQKLREKKAKAEQQRDQAENDMQNIASQILANPQQESVPQEMKKWEQRTGDLERDRQENRTLERQLQEEKRSHQKELARMRPELQKISREEQSQKDQWEKIQEEHQSLLLRMKELSSELYAVQSIYIQQSTVLNHFEGSTENLRLLKERAILKESQALALHHFYEPSSYYAADPVVETYVSEWREQFGYLEAGAVYVEKAAGQLGHSVSEYFQIYPFWAISLICRASEAEKLVSRLQRQAGMLTHPVFVLSQEEARSILDSLGSETGQPAPAARQVFPSGWEVNLSREAFHNWKQILEKNANEASFERRRQETQLQIALDYLKQLQEFLSRYPYEQTRQLQQSWRENREQMIELDQNIRVREERLEEIDGWLQSLNKKHIEIIAEHNNLSNWILKAHDYMRKASERDNARLDWQQCLELLPAQERDLERLKSQKERTEGSQRQLQADLQTVQYDLRHLQDETLYKEVISALPQASSQSRPTLEMERQGLVDALHQKQRGRQNLEDLLHQTRATKKNQENDLQRQLMGCDTEIEDDFIFPPGGDEEINSIILQIRALKQLLKRLQPGLDQSDKDHTIAQDRFKRKEAEYYQKYSERLYFSQALATVRDELAQEEEAIETRQKYQDEQMQRLTAESDLFKQAMNELERKNERYDYLQDSIVYTELPSPIRNDFSYQPLAIINRYIKELQEKQSTVNKLGEELEQEKIRLQRFCQEELRDIKLRRMVASGLQYRDNYQAVTEWKERLSNRIHLAIRHAEDDMREHDRELQQFINYLHSYLLTMARELRLIPRKTRVKAEDNWKEIFQFDVPDWDEKEGKSELRRHVDWMISQIESDRYRDENGSENYALMHKDIEKWLQPQQLLRNVMKEKNIRVRCRKVTADGKVSSHPSAWEGSNQWSGGEKWSKNMALFLGIQNYLAEKRQAVNPRVKRNRVVILDNPFGKASSDHVLDPVFFIAEQLGFQIIALTALAEGKFIRDYFPIVYSCRLRPSTSPDKYLVSTEKEIRHAFFQDHEPEALPRLGEQKQMELF